MIDRMYKFAYLIALHSNSYRCMRNVSNESYIKMLAFKWYGIKKDKWRFCFSNPSRHYLATKSFKDNPPVVILDYHHKMPISTTLLNQDFAFVLRNEGVILESDKYVTVPCLSSISQIKHGNIFASIDEMRTKEFLDVYHSFSVISQ